MTPSASHRTDLAQPVTVELWVVVCAIRYGTGRMTYANADAVSLALTHWQALPGFIRDQIVRDAQSLPDGYERQAWQPVIDLQDGHPTGDTPPSELWARRVRAQIDDDTCPIEDCMRCAAAILTPALAHALRHSSIPSTRSTGAGDE